MDLDAAKQQIKAAREGRAVALDVLFDLLVFVGTLDDELAKVKQRLRVLDGQVHTLQQRVDVLARGGPRSVDR